MKWYCELFGFQVLDVSPRNAMLEIAPGQIFCLTTDDHAAKDFCILCKEIEPIRQRVVDHHIHLEEDLPHWLVFRDPDQNEIGVWLVPTTDFETPKEVIYNTIRFQPQSKEESHFVIRSIEDPGDYPSAFVELLQQCKQMGVFPQDKAVGISKYSDQIDALYVGIPISGAPSRDLPEGMEHLVIPAQEYSVYPIHNSKWEDGGTKQLVNRIRHSDQALCRPKQFYIIERNVNDEYLEVSIPYVWTDA